MKPCYTDHKSMKLIDFGFTHPTDKSGLREKAKMGEEYKKVESDVFKFETEGAVIEGRLIAVSDSAQFNNKVYKIETDQGVKTVFGTVILDDLMAMVVIGKQVKILFIGEKEAKKGQNPTKLFEVFYK